MILTGSLVNITDNSGAKKVQCIKLKKQSSKKGAKIGDLVLGSVKQIKQKGKIKQGDVVQVLITETKFGQKRKDGQTVKFGRNAGVVLSNQMLPIASRIMSAIPFEIRKKKYQKVVSLAPYLM